MTNHETLVALPSRSDHDVDETFVHYYDQHPTAEDVMGESATQSQLIFYLLQVLHRRYHTEGWFVINDLNIYRSKQRNEHPLAPDVAVFKGVVVPNRAARTFRSWRLYEPERPAPHVVFEICSDSTWQDDVQEKPAKYAALGVEEYVAYDPNDPPYVANAQGRLRGWRLVDGIMVEQERDAQGRWWSAELDSYLVPDGAFLRLADRGGQRRLTQAEAEYVAREAAEAAKEAAWAKLRELGIDPTTL